MGESGQRYSLAELLRVMQRLRDPDHGCPWDLCQNFHSIVPSTLEECYELAQAIEHGEFDHVEEELGDVLFQVVFYTQLGREQGLFSFESVVDTLVTKLIRRHPHVFAKGEIEGVVEVRTSVEDVKRSWEAIKQRERDSKDHGGVLADVPLALPALPRAQKVQKRAAQVNFDWTDSHAVLDKLQEELDELRRALGNRNQEEVRDEMGDVLFTCVNLARHLGLDAEASLRQATGKFERRFRYLEGIAAARGVSLSALTPDQYDALWRQSKEALQDSQPDL
ncbi:MAG: nucleoside triphosphate pyrophosphohydrolase [Halioglobus sp.]